MTHREHAQPLTGPEITQEHKDEFVNLIYEGFKANMAARQIGTTGTVMRRLRNPRGVHYDPRFARAWAEAEASEEHFANYRARVEDKLDERAQDSDTILLKEAMTVIPRYEKLRHQNFHHDHAIRAQIMAEEIPSLTDEQIEEAIRRREEMEQRRPLRALPSGE